MYMELWQSAATGWASMGLRTAPLSQHLSYCYIAFMLQASRGGLARLMKNLLSNVHRLPILAELSPCGPVERFSGGCFLDVFNATCVQPTCTVFITQKSLSKCTKTSA